MVKSIRLSNPVRALALAAVLAAAAAAIAGPAAAQSPTNRPPAGRCTPNSVAGNWPNPTIIQFDVGKSTIHPDDAKKIAETAKLAKANYIQQICVRGSADKQGNAAANLKLSRARAEAVAAALRKNGVDPKTIVVVAQGEPGGALGSGSDSIFSSQADRSVQIRFTR